MSPIILCLQIILLDGIAEVSRYAIAPLLDGLVQLSRASQTLVILTCALASVLGHSQQFLLLSLILAPG